MLQRYRSDVAETQPDGATVWRATSQYGTVLSKIDKCRLENLVGDMRRTVYVTGEPNTWFSVPARCVLMGCVVNGYVTGDDEGNLVFQHTYY